MEYCYYIGIDIDDQNSVVTCYRTGMKEPETLSMIAGSELFQIPVLIRKRKGISQWFIGEETKKEDVSWEAPVDRLISRSLAGESLQIGEETYDALELLSLYLKKLCILANGIGNSGTPDKIVIAVEKISGELTELFRLAAEKIGFERQKVSLIDRKEGFYYFSLNQAEELWRHDVFLFDFREETLNCTVLQRNLKTSPQVVTLEEALCQIGEENKDSIFSGILQQCFKGRIVSSVYLVGSGFEGEWMKQSIAFMCRGRRAFAGKNLYSKGACYAAMVSDGKIEWPYVYIGDNEMKLNVSLKVKSGGKQEFFSLIDAGDNWYEAVGHCEVILDGSPEIDFWLQPPDSRDARVEKLTLADWPERENKTTRLRITAKPLSDTKVQIQILDLGFGGIVKSSGKSWDYIMSL